MDYGSYLKEGPLKLKGKDLTLYRSPVLELGREGLKRGEEDEGVSGKKSLALTDAGRSIAGPGRSFCGILND